jgi:hypothetical protein
MVLKSVCAAVTCALWFAGGSAWATEDYRPGEYLNLDLSKAVLSPKRLGPPAEFAPLPVEARTDTKRVATERIVATPPKVRVAQPRIEKPRPPARSKLAHRRSNPLDANAMDRRSRRPVQTAVQTWPCKSGGICNWKR